MFTHAITHVANALQPANIFATKLSHAKTLDFGLAKLGHTGSDIPSADTAAGFDTRDTLLSIIGLAE